jgi:FkbM family methyltransferase
MTFVSYSQNREDVLLWRALKHIEKGHYIDIGAWDPTKDSVSKGFYELGWRGINIEPVSNFAESLSKDRPLDRIINKAVGNTSGRKKIYNISETGLSTFSKKLAEHYFEKGLLVTEEEVEIFRLEELGNPFDCGDVHWMKIDVEGSELEVLSGWNSTELRPWIIVIESVEPIRLQSVRLEWEHLLINAGYKFAYFDGLNDFYVDLAHEELLKSFDVPINFTDDYIVVSELESHNEAVNLHRELSQTKEERENLHRELSQTKEERENLQGMLSRKNLEFVSLTQQFDSLINDKNELANRLAILSVLTMPAKESLDLKRILNKPYTFLLHHRSLMRISLLIIHKFKLKEFGEICLRSKTFKIIFLIYRFKLYPELAPIRKKRKNTVSQILKVLNRDITKLTPRTFRKNSKYLSISRFRLQRAYKNFDRIDTRLKDWDSKLLSLVVGNKNNWKKFKLDLEIDVSIVAKRLQDVRQEKAMRCKTSFEQIIVDARCMSEPAFKTRGIGTYGKSLLHSLLKLSSTINLIIIGNAEDFESDIQSRFEFKDPEFINSCDSFKISTWFIQLSPMTCNPLPIASILFSPRVMSTSFVFDLIPFSYPSFYLPTKEKRDSYINQLKILEFYDEHLFISESTMQEFDKLVKTNSARSIIWPDQLIPNNWLESPKNIVLGKPITKRMLILSGDDPRKNIPMALKVAEYALIKGMVEDVAIVGYGNNANYISSLIKTLNCDKSKIDVCGYLSNQEYQSLLAGSIVSIVCSFAEGLSLPVIESIMSGVPVVISDIPAHLELVGKGYWAANPMDLKSLCAALETTLEKPVETYRAQRRFMKAHKSMGVQDYVLNTINNSMSNKSKIPRQSTPPSPKNLQNIVISTPLPPARSGIADHSRFWIPYLAKIANVTVLTNKEVDSFANVTLSRYDSKEWLSSKYDARINVLGNSHYHLQGIHLIPAPNTLSICHDVRMTELVNSTGIISPPPIKQHSFEIDLRDQLRHKLDHTCDLNFGFIGRISENLLFHSEKISKRIAYQYGFSTYYLPLIPYRFPNVGENWISKHKDIEWSIEKRPINIGFFGDADIETKSIDTIIEAINWLTDWGLDVKLKIIGNMNPRIKNKLREFFTKTELNRIIEIGYLSEQKYRAELGSIDLAIELRTANLLGLSGSLADLVAFGVPTVVTQGLIDQMELPSYCFSVGNDYTPLIVALELQKVINLMTKGNAFISIEEERKSWIQDRTPDRYVNQLVEILKELKD